LKHFECAFKYEDVDLIDGVRIEGKHESTGTAPGAYSRKKRGVEKAKINVYQGECGGGLDAVLEAYRAHYESLPGRKRVDGLSFNLPVGALRCIWRFKSLSSTGGLLCLTGDKGNIDPSEFQGMRAPAMASHGCFSMMVNFHAMKLFFDCLAGLTLLTPYIHSSLKVAASVLPPATAPKLSLMNLISAFERGPAQYGPNEFSELSEALRWGYHPYVGLDTISSLIFLSHDDVELVEDYTKVYKRVYRCANPNTRHNVSGRAAPILSNDFSVSEGDDVAFVLGRLCQRGGQYKEAVRLYNESIAKGKGSEKTNQSHITYSNRGICLYKLGQYAKAKDSFKSAIVSQQGGRDDILCRKTGYRKAELWYQKLSRLLGEPPELEAISHTIDENELHEETVVIENADGTDFKTEQPETDTIVPQVEKSSSETALIGMAEVHRKSLEVIEASRKRRLLLQGVPQPKPEVGVIKVSQASESCTGQESGMEQLKVGAGGNSQPNPGTTLAEMRKIQTAFMERLERSLTNGPNAKA